MLTFPFSTTVVTFVVGTLGAALAVLLDVPAALLVGPSLAVCLAGVFGLKMAVPAQIRDAAFILIGIGIGSLVTDNTTDAILRWPLAFLAMGVMLALTMYLSQLILQKRFGFDARSAILASAPGHLSFVMGLGTEMGIDTLRVSVAQSLRLLSLTILVPFFALALGVKIPANALVGGVALGWTTLGILALISLVTGLLLQKLRMPAALLIGAMVVSAFAHGAGWVHGGLHPWIGAAAFVCLGTLIGTRFTGVTPRLLVQSAGAGLASTLIASVMTVLFSVPVARLLGMTDPTVLTAFAPGGFETMVALGAVVGAHPGFVAACHLFRLLLLTGLIPAFLRFARDA